MTRLLVLADTHVPARARDLAEPVWRAVDAAEVVVHAGDWVTVDLLDRLLERLGGDPARLVAVVGNNDGPQLRARLPEVARAEVGGIRLAVVHETAAEPLSPTAATRGRGVQWPARRGAVAAPADVSALLPGTGLPWRGAGGRGPGRRPVRGPAPGQR
ncbi:MAG: metallophosphoesterase family protein [Kineosporiaceae bacterium]